MFKNWKAAALSLVVGLSVVGCGSADKPAAPASSTPTSAAPTAEAKELVVVDWGGASSEAAKKAVYEAFEKAKGVKITVVSPTDTGKLKAMVQAGNVEWDVVNSDTDVALRLEKEGLLEKLDYNVIDKTDIYPELVTDFTIGLQLYYTNIAYSSELFSADNHPKTWAEFWDTEKFPGARSLYRSPMGTLESALLADGVTPDKLYPLDVERALASLNKLKKDVKVWWDAGAQPPQLLATKEVGVAAAWNGRVSAAKTKGSKVDNEFNEALGMSTSWIIPKGAVHKELAQEFISFALKPEQQAAYSQLIDYAPTNKKALDLLPEDVKQRLGSGQKNKIMIDVKYWAENFDKVNERFNKWLLE